MKTKFSKPAGPANIYNAPQESYRFTVVRLSDKHERHADRMPRIEIRKSPDFMVWDNRENCQVKP